MTKLKVGLQLHPQRVSYADYAAAVQATEALGVDTIWNWDHFFPLYGEGEGDHFEGWTLLTAIAMLTSRVEIGTLVTCNSYRNPALLAHMANTLDHISGGRLILGIGAGWFEKDYVEFGYEFGTAGSRLRDLGESLPIIKQRMTKELPPPVRNPIPIMVGGGGEKVTLKLTAQHADLWNGFGPPATYAHKNRVLDDWCATVGRDPSEIERTVSITQNDNIPGDLDAFAEAGARHFIMMTAAPPDYERAKALVAWRDKANGG
ncbi:MAG: LLM class F420-dependent oxidoreductase [Chloroflexi bacterium]|nr:LLM class F420-dependent oxidoreductase [Chloroflexota bacterium]MCY3583891.1 LLM class F420-dependent oxidoreductase [Chloroflexota bacterium]MCY3717627.1 LLM class F420-dependent oxidoreductase [Chloroflexota bacterium]MDE2651248.1 LLM class F420-dependent oxidoreductase [Chloroflexota bacterium]MXV93728.1 LLM class F420-dependent oxidoreductase [Chloroflexota bacterium]